MEQKSLPLPRDDYESESIGPRKFQLLFPFSPQPKPNGQQWKFREQKYKPFLEAVALFTRTRWSGPPIAGKLKYRGYIMLKKKPRGDPSNLHDGILDAIEKAGIITNDKHVVEEHRYCKFTAEVDCFEVVIVQI